VRQQRAGWFDATIALSRSGARISHGSCLISQESKEHAMEPRRPQDGDVLVSKPTAIVEHEICIVPRSPHITCANHNRAVTEGRLLAEQLKVDVWLTEDNCHFLRIGSYRQ